MKKDSPDVNRSLWRESLRAISLGWDLAVPIFCGVLFGYYIDRWLSTGHIFTIGLLILGIAIGYYNLARFIKRVAKHNQKTSNQQVEEYNHKNNKPDE